MRDYIKEREVQNRGSHFVWIKEIDIYNSQTLPDTVDIQAVLSEVEERIPPFMLSGIETIFFGEIAALAERDLDAMYENGTIYIRSSSVFNEEDLVDDILHEVSHSLEDKYGLDIYGDGSIEKEFLDKRVKLYKKLAANGMWMPPLVSFANLDFDPDLDSYFYNTVGYPLLTSLTVNLFVSPYGATSLREYFANGFEKYFLGEHKSVKEISPSISKKIEQLVTLSKESEYGTI